MRNTLKHLLLLCTLVSISACSTSRTKVDGTKKDKSVGEVIFLGGDGSSLVRAVIITNAKTSYQGIQAETVYLEKTHGIRNLDWRMISQDLLEAKNKTYDVLTIEKVASKKEVKVYFDITSFYGKL
jgi:tRNA A22 N-methylase